MSNPGFSTSFLVNETPKEVYNAINNVRGWWSEKVEGGTQMLNDEFIYRHKDIHYSKQKLIELVPNKKIVWLITDSSLSFVKGNKSEWTGTRVIFDISQQGNKTKIDFTHEGLVPEFECFEGCSGGWSHYLKLSLLPLIATGTGQPDREMI